MKVYYYLFIGLLTCSIFCSTDSYSQTKKDLNNWERYHYLSKEEMKAPFKETRAFTETDPPTGPIRQCAEFEQMQGVLVRYPFRIPVELVKQMAEVVPVTTLCRAYEISSITSTYQAAGVNMDNIEFADIRTDSFWIRDYGPWFFFDGNRNPGICNFPYNRPRPYDNDVPIAMGTHLNVPVYGMNVTQTGGNYMCDGYGKAAQTELVWEENSNKTHAQIAQKHLDYLGISDHMIIDDPLGDYIKHIDCWGKFLDVDKVMIAEVAESDSRYAAYEAAANYFKTHNSSYGKPYEVYRVFTAGGQAITAYTNSLIVNDHVFVPISGNPNDNAALLKYQEAMPGYTIQGITYSSWMNTDALHCRTRGIPDLGMLYISHIPLQGEVKFADNFSINTDIIAYSGEDIYSDSVKIYYRINDGAWMNKTMTYVSGDKYTTQLNAMVGDEVEYYLYAADESNRRIKSPYIGASDPHVFTVVPYLTDIINFTPSISTFDKNQISQDVTLTNNTSDPVIINYIEEDQDYWKIKDRPKLPLRLDHNDKLQFTIEVNPYNELRDDYLIDSIEFRTSTNNSFYSRLKINKTVISQANDLMKETNFSVYPNPVSKDAYIYLNINQPQKVKLTLYDISGRKIGIIVDKTLNSGDHKIYWNATNSDGDHLPQGAYFIHFSSGKYEMTQKVLIVH
ncbi:MAG: agmatine deiminase family protein [Hyphomicrobiales bacterium]